MVRETRNICNGFYSYSQCEVQLLGELFGGWSAKSRRLLLQCHYGFIISIGFRDGFAVVHLPFYIQLQQGLFGAGFGCGFGSSSFSLAIFPEFMQEFY